jgi:DNA-binding MarR family transcriptional regulator
MTLAEQVASLRRTINRLLSRRLAEQSERPFQQLCALRTIAQGDAQTQAEVSEFLIVDPPAVSRMVDKLEEDGLLRRLPGKDRRCLRLEATDAAKPEIEALVANLEWLDGEVLKHLSRDEVDTLMRLMAKLQAGIVEAGGR